MNKEVVLRQIIRGERPWSDLSDLDISVHERDDKFTIENPSGLSVPIRASDLAAGLLSYKHDPAKARQWASLILADAMPCDLELAESGPEQAFLEALWDVAFGKGVSPKTEALANELAEE